MHLSRCCPCAVQILAPSQIETDNETDCGPEALWGHVERSIEAPSWWRSQAKVEPALRCAQRANLRGKKASERGGKGKGWAGGLLPPGPSEPLNRPLKPWWGCCVATNSSERCGGSEGGGGRRPWQAAQERGCVLFPQHCSRSCSSAPSRGRDRQPQSRLAGR